MRRTRGFRKRRALQEVQLEVVLALDGAPHEHVVGGKVQRAERLRRLAQRPKHRPRASLRGHVGCRSDAVEFESLCCASRILAFFRRIAAPCLDVRLSSTCNTIKSTSALSSSYKENFRFTIRLVGCYFLHETRALPCIYFLICKSCLAKRLWHSTASWAVAGEPAFLLHLSRSNGSAGSQNLVEKTNFPQAQRRVVNRAVNADALKTLLIIVFFPLKNARVGD